MKSKIYITGAAGFIGFHTAKKFLDKGIKIHGFDSINNYYDPNLKKSRLKILKKYKNFSFTKGLLENERLLNQSVLKFKPSIIIHLAAQAGVRYSIKNPDIYFSSNILGTFNLLKISNKIRVKHLIIGSSSSIYGANKKIPFKEIFFIIFAFIIIYVYIKNIHSIIMKHIIIFWIVIFSIFIFLNTFSNFVIVRIMANIKQNGINLVRTFDSVKIEYMKYVRKPCPSSTTRSRKFTA